jgi:hypothetical protein
MTGECKPCDSECEHCINETRCISCRFNKHLLDGKCVNACPLGFFLGNSSCSLCYPSCESCYGPSKKNCLFCTKGFKYSQEIMECVSDCPDGTYFNDLLNICSLCDTKNCINCIKEPAMCIKCGDNFALDTATFACKQCCRNTIGHNDHCCQCPQRFNGFCLDSNCTRNELDFLSLKLNLNLEIKYDAWSFLIFIFFLIVLILFTVSVIFFRSFRKFDQKFNSIEYSYLKVNDDNIN